MEFLKKLNDCFRDASGIVSFITLLVNWFLFERTKEPDKKKDQIVNITD